MSGYGESTQEPYVYEYATTRSTQESYAGLAPPPFDPRFPSTQPAEPHALASTSRMPYLGQPFEPRDTGFQTGSSSLTAARSRSAPEPTSSGPFNGRAGEKIRIEFRSQTDYSALRVVFTLMFSEASSKAEVLKNFYREPNYFYTLTADIPPYEDTKHLTKTMPLLLDVEDENGQKLDLAHFGSFTYFDDTPLPPFVTAPPVSRKRKIGEDSQGFAPSPPKRAASQPLQAKYTSSAMYGPVQTPLSGPPPFFGSSTPLFALPQTYDRPAPHQRGYGQPLAQSPSFPYVASPGMQQAKVRSPSAATYSTYGTLARPSASPRLPATPRVTATQMARSPSYSSNPPLIRTSILEDKLSTSTRASSSRGFNPYAQYPNAKAELNISGSLMSMTEEWTPEEREARRRLVEFSRMQSGSIVTTSFRAVSPEERTPNSACVSCIYWEERDEYFVTSVDTIALLEALVAVRFTVEEKNRIRRNLEGFKPLTVSKLKEDTDSFFRLIMSFPNPKPRNIEKDVKVFPWAILESSLKKIFGKYSASYASTASHLLPGPSNTSSEPTFEHRPTASPRSTTSSAISNIQTGMTSTALSPNIGASSGLEFQEREEPVSTLLPAARIGAHEPRGSISQMMPQSLGQWQAQYAPPSQYHQMPAPGRPSWDMGGYLQQSPVQANPSAAQPLHYSYGAQASEQTSAADEKPYTATTQQTMAG